jgi:hypothetical protein
MKDVMRSKWCVIRAKLRKCDIGLRIWKEVSVRGAAWVVDIFSPEG